jgi:hypothetical protein
MYVFVRFWVLEMNRGYSGCMYVYIRFCTYYFLLFQSCMLWFLCYPLIVVISWIIYEYLRYKVNVTMFYEYLRYKVNVTMFYEYLRYKVNVTMFYEYLRYKVNFTMFYEYLRYKVNFTMFYEYLRYKVNVTMFSNCVSYTNVEVELYCVLH